MRSRMIRQQPGQSHHSRIEGVVQAAQPGFPGAVRIPVYMLISLRVVYKQSWLITTSKYVMIGISYMTLLGLVTMGVAIASFVLL